MKYEYGALVEMWFMQNIREIWKLWKNYV